MQDDFYLIEQLKKNDKAAYEQLYYKYWDRLYTIASARLRSTEQTEEILQDVFLDLWLRRHTLQIKSSLLGYLYQVLKYKIVDFIRSQKSNRDWIKEISQTLESSENTTEQKYLAEELNLILFKKADTLPQRCKEIFLLSRKEYLSNPEIAEKLGLSIKTVENQLSKAIRQIKLFIKDFVTES
ncbi:MAG: RNA polymerase sigma factor [Candidatus Cyclobacteriaceae bacterium M3_2C_046]